MAHPNIAPYGSWKSPITADVVAAGEVGLEQVRLDGDDVYWIERRSQEGGRKVIVRRSPDGRLTDMTPVGFNARTRVHEYGGGDYAVSDGTIVFSNFVDQRLYVQRPGAEPTALTSATALRYADGQIDRQRNLFFCVREDHTVQGEAINTVVSIDLMEGGSGRVLVSGNDFYSSPRLNPDGSRLAWLTWNHPNMPWDGTELWVGKLNQDGSMGEATRVAGGGNESIFQPEWSPDGTLYFVSDRTGWWNIYRWRDEKVEALCPMDAEFGQPQWVFASSLYGFVSERRIVCSYTKNGRDYLATLDTRDRELDDIELPFTAISQVRAAGDRAVFIGASSTEPTCIVSLNLATKSRRCYEDREKQLSMPDISPIPEPLSFPPRAVLPLTAFLSTAESRLHGAGERKTAAVGHEPRRADLSQFRIAQVRHSVLDQPGYSYSRCKLWR